MIDTAYYIGIDPGLNGAIAILNTEGTLIYLRDMPKRRDCSKDVVDICELSRDFRLIEIILHHKAKVAIERVQAIAGPGHALSPSSACGMGKSAGRIEGFIEAFKVLPTMVMPTVWKRHHGLLKKTKKDSVFLARQLFPEYQSQFLVSKDGRAEACLIAKWLFDQEHGK